MDHVLGKSLGYFIQVIYVSYGTLQNASRTCLSFEGKKKKKLKSKKSTNV